MDREELKALNIKQQEHQRKLKRQVVAIEKLYQQTEDIQKRNKLLLWKRDIEDCILRNGRFLHHLQDRLNSMRRAI